MLVRILTLPIREINPAEIAQEFFFDRLRLVECRLRFLDL
jgi:hypothetical protein